MGRVDTPSLPMTPQADLGIFVVSVCAGLIGSLAGVGGGILVIPALTFVFGVDIHLAVGASIVSVIATSSGAAAAYVRDRMTDMRIGMFLELATTTGAVTGALLAAVVAPAFLYVLLGVVLLGSAAMQVARLDEEMPPAGPPSRIAAAMKLSSSYPDRRLGREVPYTARRVPLGFVLMWIAGVVSGLLGIGSGCSQGARHGRGDAAADEGQLGHEQLHDRGHGRGFGRDLPGPRRRGSADRGAGCARSAGRRADRRAAAQPGLEPRGSADLPAGARGRGSRDHRPRIGVWTMSPQRFRLMVSLVLAVGVGISATLIGVGFVAALAVGWQGSLIGAATTAGAPTTDFGGLTSRLGILEPLAITQLGLLTLLATPVVRVAASVVAFASEGDRLYTVITLVVLAILLASILLLR